jgi:hypothetical protein
MRRSLAAVLLTLVAALAAGCGTTTDSAADFEGSEQDVANVVEDLQTAAADDEAETVCRRLLSAALTRQLGGGCTRAIDQAFDDADSFELGADSVRVTGQTARAQIIAGSEEQPRELLEFVREGDSWRISRFAGAGR